MFAGCQLQDSLAPDRHQPVLQHRARQPHAGVHRHHVHAPPAWPASSRTFGGEVELEVEQLANGTVKLVGRRSSTPTPLAIDDPLHHEVYNEQLDREQEHRRKSTRSDGILGRDRSEPDVGKQQRRGKR